MDLETSSADLCANVNYIGRRKPVTASGTSTRKFELSPVPVPHPLLFLISTSLTVKPSMKNHTDTLEIGSRAPDFSLHAANREGTFTLGGTLAEGNLILEFLRGTW